MSNRAWVTLATNDSYGLGALVLAHSLRRVGSTHPSAVLITPAVTEAMRDRLRGVFAEVVLVDVLDSRDAAHLALLQRPELGITFTKIHCWTLTQYDKCVFLDADTLVVQNCDELFDREELSAAPDVGWPDCFNSGVFVFKPSNETFEALVRFAQERGSFDGGDQGLLNSFFSNWARGDINKHLPFLYNVTSAAFYSYIPALKHFGENMKIIHFIGAGKPWLQNFNWETRTVSAPDHLRELLQLWWDLFVAQVHLHLDTTMSGVAGNLARVSPDDISSQREVLDELTRRQGWEAGNMDYMGADSFANIWAKISETLSQPRQSPPKQSTPPPKEPTPIKEPTPPKESTALAKESTASVEQTRSVLEESKPDNIASEASTVPAKEVQPAVSAPELVAAVEPKVVSETENVVQIEPQLEVIPKVEQESTVKLSFGPEVNKQSEEYKTESDMSVIIEPEVVAKVQQESTTQIEQVISDPKVQSESRTVAECVSESTVNTEIQAISEAEIKSESVTEADSASESTTKSETPAVSESEVKPELVATTESTSESTAKPECRVISVIQTKPETEIKSKIPIPLEDIPDRTTKTEPVISPETTSENIVKTQAEVTQSEPAVIQTPLAVEKIEKTKSEVVIAAVPSAEPTSEPLTVLSTPLTESDSDAQLEKPVAEPTQTVTQLSELATESIVQAAEAAAEILKTAATAMPSAEISSSPTTAVKAPIEASLSTPGKEEEKILSTPDKNLEVSKDSASDSPPLATTPAKEELPPTAAKSGAAGSRGRRPAQPLQLTPPTAPTLPPATPDSEVEDVAALAQSIIAGELATPTVTAPTPPAPTSPPTPPVSLAQIGVKPAPKDKTSTAAQIASSVSDTKDGAKQKPKQPAAAAQPEQSESPSTPSTPSEPTTPGTPTSPTGPATSAAKEEPAKKKVVKKVKKESATVESPVPPPRKKEKKPKDK